MQLFQIRKVFLPLVFFLCSLAWADLSSKRGLVQTQSINRYQLNKDKISGMNGHGIVRKLQVLTYRYVPTGKSEDDYAQVFYHIITPHKRNSGIFYRYDLTGYLFIESSPISLAFTGYIYSHANEPPFFEHEQEQQYPVSGHVLDENKAAPNDRNNWYIRPVTAEQYFTDDGYLVLKFGPFVQYCNFFVLDYLGDEYDSSYGYIVKTIIRSTESQNIKLRVDPIIRTAKDPQK